MKSLWRIIKGTFSDFLEDRAMRLAAALAFYAMFSLGPMLVIIVAIAGFVWGERAAQGALAQQFASVVGDQAAQQIQEIIAAAQKTNGGVLATIIGIAILIFASTGVFAALRDALNTVWEVRVKSGGVIWSTIKNRLLAFGVVIAIAILLLAMLVATAAVSSLARNSGSTSIPWVQVGEFFASWFISAILFAAIFKWLPEVKISWKDVIFGAIVTALLFCLGKLAIGWYLGRSSVASVYGAAGSLVAILIWIYYSSIIFLFGAELTQVWAKRYGKRIQPSENAVAMTNEQRAQQGMGTSKRRDEPDADTTAQRSMRKSHGRADSQTDRSDVDAPIERHPPGTPDVNRRAPQDTDQSRQ